MDPALVEEAYRLLYEKDLPYVPSLKYSGRFSDYNANVRLYRGTLEFRLCRKWEDVSREIQIGLIQGLMLRMFRDRRKTLYTDLYTNFGGSLTMITSLFLTSVGAVYIVNQQLTMGALVATNMLSSRLLGPLNQLVGQWRTYNSFKQ